MHPFNIHLSGVGGQGIGLLSETVLRAVDHAGHPVKAVDTHGLAQRGGIVVSQIRMGEKVYSPLVPEGEADVVISLERHEALRSLQQMAKGGAILVYFDTVWQPLPVRLNTDAEVTREEIDAACRARNVKQVRIDKQTIPDVRMQNMVLLGAISGGGIIPGVLSAHYRKALGDLLSGGMLENNLALFEKMESKYAEKVGT